MQRVMILGAGGMLGHKLCQRLSARPGCEVVGVVRASAARYVAYTDVFERVTLVDGADVLEPGTLERLVAEYRPRNVINAVGIVKQLAEAEDRYLSVAVNAFLPHRLARLCEQAGARLVHLSTDCVFDGSRGGYREEDPTDARDLYGRSKYLGETDAGESAAVTLRSSIIGRELSRPTHGLLEWFLAERGGRVRGFERAIYSGFTTLEMARIVERVIDAERPPTGLVHVASEPISKYSLLELIRRTFALDVEIERDESFVCDRSLVMERFTNETGYEAPSWERMIGELSQDPTPYDAYQAGD